MSNNKVKTLTYTNGFKVGDKVYCKKEQLLSLEIKPEYIKGVIVTFIPRLITIERSVLPDKKILKIFALVEIETNKVKRFFEYSLIDLYKIKSKKTKREQ